VEVSYTVYHNSSTVAAGKAAGVVGSGELPAWIEGIVVGMHPGEVRKGEVPPWEAFGRVNYSLIRWEPRSMSLPRRVVMSRESFLRRFGEEPEAGKLLRLRLYTLRVLEVNGSRVLAERVAERRSLSSECGNLSILQNATTITYFFTPVLNTTCTRNGEFLRYLAVNATHVLVDRNHPLAGKWLSARVELRALIKSQQRGEVWLSSMEQAQRVSAAEHKPVLAFFGREEPYPQPWLLGLNRSAVLLRLTSEAAGRLGIEQAPAFALLYRNETVVVHGIPPPASLLELIEGMEAGK